MASRHASYTFGLTEIDDQHEAIQTLLDTLLVNACRECRPGVLRPLLDKLRVRLAAHFAVEEAVIELLSPAEARRHLAAHADILNSLEDCVRQLNGKTDTTDFRLSVVALGDLVCTHDAGFIAYLDVLRGHLAPSSVARATGSGSMRMPQITPATSSPIPSCVGAAGHAPRRRNA